MKLKSIKFSNHPVLKDLSFNFEIEDNIKDITLLLGENGCGKTVLLEEIHKIINEGLRLWNDGINREITFVFSDEEQDILEIPSNTVVFQYSEGPERQNWAWFKINTTTQDITGSLLPKLQDGSINRVLKGAYSNIEINFASEKIEAVRSTSIDNEENPKKRSGPSIATEIAQLLVDIKAQDNADIATWYEENTGKTVGKLPEFDVKLDRFKKAYHNMFQNKELCDIRAEDGEQKILFKDTQDDSEFDITGLSSGEKQVVYRVGYLLRNLKTIAGGIILIDEPELSLHPRWQIRYINFLRELFTEDGEMKVQFIIATHSPYLLKTTGLEDMGIAILRRDGDSLLVERPDTNWSLFNAGPTIGEINYYAFNLPTIDFHNELYGYIEEASKSVEACFEKKEYHWIEIRDGKKIDEYDVSLPTFIRHSIHHPENNFNDDFNDDQLRESIEQMALVADKLKGKVLVKKE